MAKISNKKRKVIVEPFGEVHINASFNNIIISFTNNKGEVIAWSSAGKMGFRGSKKNTPYAAQLAAEDAEPLFGVDKSLDKKNYPPGQHGINKRRQKKSEYAIQLMEKQKAKYIYGILEKQFRNLFEKANRSKGITGEVLLQLCESRLDNLVYRIGIAKTRSSARQLVSHAHILVNGNIPSRIIKVGETISVRERSKSLLVIEDSLSSNESVSEWITWDSAKMEGVYNSIPARDQIQENIKEQLIVELYSK
jgi:small subunit ribosomal protein S4